MNIERYEKDLKDIVEIGKSSLKSDFRIEVINEYNPRYIFPLGTALSQQKLLINMRHASMKRTYHMVEEGAPYKT